MDREYKNKYQNFFTNEERKEIIKRNIIELREGNNLSQKETAELLEINQQTYNAYETGRTTPPTEILVRMSYLYEIPVDIIIDRDNINRDTEQQRKTLEAYEKEIKTLKNKLSEANPEDKEKILKFIEGMEQMLKALKE